MALHLELKTQSSVPVEVEGITPDVVRDRSLDEIRRLEIFHGNVKLPLTEFFNVSGDPTDGCIEWHGDLSGVHWIGTGMSDGRIDIRGNAGRHVGSEMSGGEIHVDGDAGDWVGGEMHGGLICVGGNAGHLVGAAYRGSVRGMTGGTILIHGQAGNEIGHSMRRGLIAVGGAGDLVGFNMLAGTVLILGTSGIRHGAGMRRGTLVFLGDQQPCLLSTFRFACRHRPLAITMLLRHLRQSGFPISGDMMHVDFDMYNGDFIESGRGEVLLRA
ncbi:MAG: formylmethanofuran dehydrogenase subunit C [Planctomycetes bacterium]|nr:formylmethanofuran dehydrogenase subunit C [Planctomycetota bacterium]